MSTSRSDDEKARYALAKAGASGGRLVFSTRDEFAAHLPVLLRIFGKSAPFTTGLLSWPRMAQGQFVREDLELALTDVVTTTGREMLTMQLHGIGARRERRGAVGWDGMG